MNVYLRKKVYSLYFRASYRYLDYFSSALSRPLILIPSPTKCMRTTAACMLLSVRSVSPIDFYYIAYIKTHYSIHPVESMFTLDIEYWYIIIIGEIFYFFMEISAVLLLRACLKLELWDPSRYLSYWIVLNCCLKIPILLRRPSAVARRRPPPPLQLPGPQLLKPLIADCKVLVQLELHKNKDYTATYMHRYLHTYGNSTTFIHTY